MAGDEVVIAENAFIMVHNSWTIAIGNRHDLSDVSAVLAKIDDAMARTYVARTKAGIREVKRMMDDETWLSAKEAVEAGFATSIASSTDKGAQAAFDLSVFANAPQALHWREADEPAPTKRDTERALMQDAGWSRSKARAALRVDEPSTPEPLQDAGGVELNLIAAALQAARTAISNTTTREP